MLVQAEIGSCGETGWEQGRKSSFGNEKLAGNINIFVRRVAGYLKMLWSVGISKSLAFWTAAVFTRSEPI